MNPLLKVAWIGLVGLAAIPAGAPADATAAAARAKPGTLEAARVVTAAMGV